MSHLSSITDQKKKKKIPERKTPERTLLAGIPEKYLGGNRKTLCGPLNLVDFLRMVLALQAKMES